MLTAVYLAEQILSPVPELVKLNFNGVGLTSGLYNDSSIIQPCYQTLYAFYRGLLELHFWKRFGKACAKASHLGRNLGSHLECDMVESFVYPAIPTNDFMLTSVRQVEHEIMSLHNYSMVHSTCILKYIKNSLAAIRTQFT